MRDESTRCQFELGFLFQPWQWVEALEGLGFAKLRFCFWGEGGVLWIVLMAALHCFPLFVWSFCTEGVGTIVVISRDKRRPYLLSQKEFVVKRGLASSPCQQVMALSCTTGGYVALI